MYSSPIPIPIPPPQSAPVSAAVDQVEAKGEGRTKEMVHRTKAIQFLGRKAPTILQNDNGPCPLLAICNVLSLKNSLNLNPDCSEVSQEKLLSLVADRLIDSNTNINNKDAAYVENQQQNIADAIDLLPRLTTGIDVNIKFRRIDDFEFTPECAIFDLLDIPLYHGWIVDPQDLETADAIGSKSYNTLMGELVSLETKAMESEQEKNPEEDIVDFVAATTATLGVPSPTFSRCQSFDESPLATRKGDIEEEAELLRALKFSGMENSSLAEGVVSDDNLHETAYVEKSELATDSETVENKVNVDTAKTLIADDCNTLNDHNISLKSAEVDSHITVDQENNLTETVSEGIEHGKLQPLSSRLDPPAFDNTQDESRSDENGQDESTTTSDKNESRNHQTASEERDTSKLLKGAADSDVTSGQINHVHEHEAFSSSVDSSEPIYEGEERIMDPGTVAFENREPVYEGEVLLAEQVDMGSTDDGGLNKEISVKQGEIIRNFMKNSASQLTVYGLFCLQEKVKERELCVFFRNNHFNTMFKYEGELYILATDQGFINQPDLVWEKLNEVNGDTVYMTCNFKKFKMGDHSNSTWDEHNAMASTADYLASIDNADAKENSSFNSDLQLAIALQQQEFDQQPKRSMQQQAASSGSSSLVTGPQVPLSGGKYSPSKQESKSKERCIVM